MPLIAGLMCSRECRKLVDVKVIEKNVLGKTESYSATYNKCFAITLGIQRRSGDGKSCHSSLTSCLQVCSN